MKPQHPPYHWLLVALALLGFLLVFGEAHGQLGHGTDAASHAPAQRE